MKLNLRLSILLFVSFAMMKALPSDHFPDKIYIQLTDSAALTEVCQVDTTLRWTRIFPFSKRYEVRHRANGLHLWFKSVQEMDQDSLAVRCERLKQILGVKQAFMAHQFLYRPKEEVTYITPKTPRGATALPVNDPVYPSQWHYQNRMVAGGADINLEKAWAIEKGSRDVIVAVMDYPFDPLHEDYRNNVWTNTTEVDGEPGVDDDDNGYVDDIYGYDAGSGIGSHGTHVAGTIAAINNNGIGGCGIAGGDGVTTGVRLMRCDVPLDKYSSEECARAFVYAADHGAVISSNSYTIPSSPLATEGIHYFMKNAGDYEGSPMKGGLVVWAAGNDASSKIEGPIDDPALRRDQLIAVAAVGADGDRTSYTNYGDWVDIAAPGGEYNYPGIFSTLPDNRYGLMQGTSMACPHISGIAALVVSKFKGHITPQEVKQRLMKSVNDIDRHTEGQACHGLLGSGIADAWKALLDKGMAAPACPEQLWVGKATSELVELCWVLPKDVDDHDIDSCWLQYSAVPFGDGSTEIKSIGISTLGHAAGDTLVYRYTGLAPDAPCYFRIQAQDRWGNRSSWSDEVICLQRKHQPSIYGDYLFHHFNVYRPGKLGDIDPQPLHLKFHITAPEGMQTSAGWEDPGNCLREVSLKDGLWELELNAASAVPGDYVAQLFVADAQDACVADTLRLQYHVKPGMSFDPHTIVRTDRPLDVTVGQRKGTMDLNVYDYFEDPYHLGLQLHYNENMNTEPSDIFHGLQAEVRGDTLHVEYELVDISFGWDDEPAILEVNFSVTNRLIDDKVDCVLTITLDETTGVTDLADSEIRLQRMTDSGIYLLESANVVTGIDVFSANGVHVMHFGPHTDRIDGTNWAPGCYLVQIRTAHQTVVKKIIHP